MKHEITTHNILNNFFNSSTTIENGEVYLLNEKEIALDILKDWTWYSKINNENIPEFKPYLIINKEMSAGQNTVCKLVPYKNNESWPFNPIKIKVINMQTKTIEELDYQPDFTKIVVSEFRMFYKLADHRNDNNP